MTSKVDSVIKRVDGGSGLFWSTDNGILPAGPWLTERILCRPGVHVEHLQPKRLHDLVTGAVRYRVAVRLRDVFQATETMSVFRQRGVI